MKVNPLNKDQFLLICKGLNVPENCNLDYLYDVYQTSCSAIEEVTNLTSVDSFTPINHVILILYVVNEYLYHISINKDFDTKSEELFAQIASLSGDKYITNEQLDYKNGSFLNRFNVSISTIELYVNFILRTLSSFDLTKNKVDSLIKDMLIKGFNMIKCIISLIVNGFETEAFSTWRTLHENECILICLLKYPNQLFKLYFKHITYALAYRGQIKSKEETDRIFEQIKNELNEHNLKSKDMKKYIEYGYLFGVPNLKFNEDFKLNFRDGCQKVAGLSGYNKVYETASEIAHSSPLLLYSNRDYFFNVALLNVYESFFRLENIYSTLYAKLMNNEEDRYSKIRNTYLTQIKNIYQILQANYKEKYLNKNINLDENLDNKIHQ